MEASFTIVLLPHDDEPCEVANFTIGVELFTDACEPEGKKFEKFQFDKRK